MSQSHLSTDRISDNGNYCIRYLSLTWVQTGYQTTEVISYDVSVSPEYRQDIRQRKLFHTMSQSHLSTDRISENGSYFIRWLSLTWVQTGNETTKVISCDVSVAPKYRQDIRKRQLFHTMSQFYLSTDRISDNGSYFIRCLSLPEYRQDIRQRKLFQTMVICFIVHLCWPEHSVFFRIRMSDD
jgi:uncharacterized protein YifE (UPF0438 family)